MSQTERQHAGQKACFDTDCAALKGSHLENWRLAYIGRVFPKLGLVTGLKPSFRFLDVGLGGSGYTTIEAVCLGAAPWGGDLSSAVMKTADRAAAEALPLAGWRRSRFQACSAEALPFAMASFDPVSSMAVLEHGAVLKKPRRG